METEARKTIAELIVISGRSSGLRVRIDQSLMVGRDQSCGLSVFESGVSDRHFRVFGHSPHGFRLEDLTE